MVSGALRSEIDARPEMMQRSDIVSAGIPPRAELEAMMAKPSSADVPPFVEGGTYLEAADSRQNGYNAFADWSTWLRIVTGSGAS
ncbi:hypothetical protein [Bradyrhizobium sp. USDA 4486]